MQGENIDLGNDLQQGHSNSDDVDLQQEHSSSHDEVSEDTVPGLNALLVVSIFFVPVSVYLYWFYASCKGSGNKHKRDFDECIVKMVRCGIPLSLLLAVARMKWILNLAYLSICIDLLLLIYYCTVA